MPSLLKDLQSQYAVASAESSRYGWGLLGSDVRQRNKSLQLKRRKEILLSAIEREKERIAQEDLLMIAVSDVDLDGYESDRSALSSYSSSSSSASSSSSTYPSSRDSSPEPYIPASVVRSAARSPRSPQSQTRSPTASSLRPRRARASEGSSLVARSFTLSGISAAGNLDEGLIQAFNSLGLEEQRSVLDKVPGLADAQTTGRKSATVSEAPLHLPLLGCGCRDFRRCHVYLFSFLSRFHLCVVIVSCCIFLGALSFSLFLSRCSSCFLLCPVSRYLYNNISASRGPAGWRSYIAVVVNVVDILYDTKYIHATKRKSKI